MKLAISTEEGYVSAHFGRCPVYTLVDVENGRIVSREQIPNPSHRPGYLPVFLADRGVRIILTGRVGPKADQILQAAGIQVIGGSVGTVREAIQSFVRGTT